MFPMPHDNFIIKNLKMTKFCKHFVFFKNFVQIFISKNLACQFSSKYDTMLKISDKLFKKYCLNLGQVYIEKVFEHFSEKYGKLLEPFWKIVDQFEGTRNCPNK